MEKQEPESQSAVERQYTGQVSDQLQTGLYYYNARYYSSQTARFIQTDQLNELNRYSYVKNNPLILVDPSGNSAKYIFNKELNLYSDDDPGPSSYYWTEDNGWNNGVGWVLYHQMGPTDREAYFKAKEEDGVSEYLTETYSYLEPDAGDFIFQLIAAAGCEPIDWAITLEAWKEGDFQATDMLGFLPIIPGAAGRIARSIPSREALNLGDSVFRQSRILKAIEGMAKKGDFKMVTDFLYRKLDRMGVEIRMGNGPAGTALGLNGQGIFILSNGFFSRTTAEQLFWTQHRYKSLALRRANQRDNLNLLMQLFRTDLDFLEMMKKGGLGNEIYESLLLEINRKMQAVLDAYN